MTENGMMQTNQQTPVPQSEPAVCHGFDLWSQKTCPEQPIDAQGLCLFHSQDEGKDPKTFYQSLQQKKLDQHDYDFRGYCFPPGAIFNDVEFDSATFFNGANFWGAAFFEGAKFKQGVGFTAAKFRDLARFRRTQFAVYSTFRLTSFSQRADFDGATFEKKANFEETKFEGEASFEGTKFLHVFTIEGVNFTKAFSMKAARFGAIAEFRRVSFTEPADFRYTTFSGVTIFEDIKASGAFNFRGADFSASVSFTRCDFAETDFAFVSFEGLSIFYLINFAGQSVFNSLKAANDLVFGLATFTGEASFKDLKMTASIKFGNSNFHAPVTFDHSNLGGGIEFTDSSIHSNISFKRIRAGGDLRFEKTWVWEECKSISFQGARFPVSQTFDGKGLFVFGIREDLIIDFSTATLDKVVFQRSFPVWRCRFSGCRGLDEAIFEGVDWGRRKRTEDSGIWPDRPRIHLLDEDEATGTEENQYNRANLYAEVERLYRLLRKSHTARMDAPQASDFYYGEMEMRRKARPDQQQHRFWETLYWVFGGYGEVWTRPLLWFLGLVLFCAVLYGAFGLRTSSPADLNSQPDKRVYADIKVRTPKGAGDLIQSSGQTLLHSLRTAALIGKGSNAEVLNVPGQVVETLETILGPVLLALAALAVRRQFPR